MAKNDKRAPAHLLGVDLGGTKILAAVVDREGNLLAEAKRSTKSEQGQQAVIDRIVAAAGEAVASAQLDMGQVAAVGIGAPAPVDVATGTVYNAPNLVGWDQVPLGRLLRDALDLPVHVDNDVNVGTLAEHVLGAGRGTRHMVGIFVGTGVGGGLILDGRLHRGFRYAAGEIGHMVMSADGPLCGCGRPGCLEAYASRTAIEREVRAGLEMGRPSILPQLMAQSGKSRLTSGLIAKALAADDELMGSVISQVQRYLGLLVGSLVNLLDPEMIVFGGGVVEALGDPFLEPIGRVARERYLQQRDADRVRIVAAQLGDHAGVLGAAILAGQQSGIAFSPGAPT